MLIEYKNYWYIKVTFTFFFFYRCRPVRRWENPFEWEVWLLDILLPAVFYVHMHLYINHLNILHVPVVIYSISFLYGTCTIFLNWYQHWQCTARQCPRNLKDKIPWFHCYWILIYGGIHKIKCSLKFLIF